MIPSEEKGHSVSQLETEIIAQFRDMQIEVGSPETDLIDEGILDSLTFVDLLFRMETQFGVRVDVETVDVEDFRRVRNIAQVVVRERAA